MWLLSAQARTSAHRHVRLGSAEVMVLEAAFVWSGARASRRAKLAWAPRPSVPRLRAGTFWVYGAPTRFPRPMSRV